MKKTTSIVFTGDIGFDKHMEGKWADENIYETRLSFMNENGVKAYGCYVIATPKALLEMLEESKVAHIDLGKAWIVV